MTLAKTWSIPAALLLVAGCGQVPGGNAGAAGDSATAEVSLDHHHDLSPPLHLIPTRDAADTNAEHEVKAIPRYYPAATRAPAADPVQQLRLTNNLAALTALTNWEGEGAGLTGYTITGAPPDTNGDVGPNHYVETVNSQFIIWSKTGTKLLGPSNINTLFSGFGGLCETDNDGDPIILYDPISDRWFLSQFAVTNPNPNYYQCVAVSQTNDPTGAWYRYAFAYADFNDYGKAGVWPDAYYFTYNMFHTDPTTKVQSFAGSKVCAFDRSSMLTGAAATQQCFSTATTYGGILPADLDGARQPPAGSPEYVIGLGTATNTSSQNTTLALWKFHVDWTTPANSTFTGPTEFAVAPYAPACNGGTCIPQSGTTTQLDSLADRMMYRLSYRNFGDHETLIASHSVTAGSSTGVRWYELRSPASTISVYQSGTFAPDSSYRWMGTAAMDINGAIALGYSRSSSASYPGLYFTGRLASDAAGTMSQGESTLIAGTGAQTTTSSGTALTRWGDYANLSVDPVDDCTFWFTSEYMATNGSFNWHTRVGSFRLPDCGAATTPPPSGGALTNPGFESGLTGWTAAGSTSSSTTAHSGSSSAMVGSTSATTDSSLSQTFTLPSNASTLSFWVQIHCPDSVSYDWASATLKDNATGTTTTLLSNTCSNTGAWQQVSASVAASAGHSVTLTLANHDDNYASDPTYTLYDDVAVGTTVTVTNPVANPGFETGSLSSWTAAGSASVTTASHSGSYAAQVGSTGPTTDSSIAQTFTLPSSASTLSFYYKVVCPDTITYDWATATLKDNVTGTTTTVLAKTCSNTGAWAQASASVSGSAGHSVTLTLANHDDNYAGDATYTMYDDVNVQ